ncbi:hypothetical protein [Amycolatopsis pigmentata]|uniref:Uncharacterized protein n=1 Tax=Amycolatopsis pigmentata TaxID=450801 RepID=A0ABW5G351_9PSEU
MEQLGPAVARVLGDPSFTRRARDAAAQIASAPDPRDVLRKVILPGA